MEQADATTKALEADVRMVKDEAETAQLVSTMSTSGGYT